MSLSSIPFDPDFDTAGIPQSRVRSLPPRVAFAAGILGACLIFSIAGNIILLRFLFT